MKTAVSIPDELFEEADALAKRTGKSRSEVYSDALRGHLQRQRSSSITERLNEVYDEHPLDADDRSWLAGVAASMAKRST
jgi:metal-responsive CopG/Arc/MetJ family transcriptional regulator